MFLVDRHADTADRARLAALEQGSEEWLDARLGRVTASVFVDVMRRTEASWMRVAGFVAGEKVMAETPAMRHGKHHEPQARALYELETGEDVATAGLLVHPDDARIAASPDGLVDDVGGVEIKCPANPDNHLRAWRSGAVPTQYVAQVQGSLWVSGREWWDFVSFCPNAPTEFQLVVIRCTPDPRFIQRLADDVADFLDWYEDGCPPLREKTAADVAALF